MTPWDDFKAKTVKMSTFDRHMRAWDYIEQLGDRGIGMPESILLAIEQKIFEDEDD